MIKIPTLKPQSDYFSETKKRMESRGKNPEFAITSIPSLNDKIWGIKRQEMTIVGARTSQGKSLFMNQLAWDLADQGHKVLYLSLEMSVCALQERLFCNVMKVPNYKILRGAFSEDKTIQNKWDMFCELANNSFLEYSDQIGRNWSQLDELVTSLNPKPDIIILDHINEISTGNVRDRRQAVDDYLIKFREMCIHNNFAGIVGAQINRSGQYDTGKEPRMSQLKESGKLEECADLVLLLYWEHKDNENKDKSAYQIFIEKNRGGWTGKIKLKIEPEYYNLSDWTQLDEDKVLIASKKFSRTEKDFRD